MQERTIFPRQMYLNCRFTKGIEMLKADLKIYCKGNHETENSQWWGYNDETRIHRECLSSWCSCFVKMIENTIKVKINHFRRSLSKGQ